MNYTDVFSMPPAAAVCYSGYREGQQPGINDPSYEQVKEGTAEGARQGQ